MVAMKGDTYVSTPTYDEDTKAVTYAVSAPLWENGIPGTTPVGACLLYTSDAADE